MPKRAREEFRRVRHFRDSSIWRAPMAHQAILAAQERRRQTAAEAGGFMRKTKRRQGEQNLRQALAAESGRLAELFAIWDADGDGSINRKEFSRALKMMGLRVSKEDFHAFLMRTSTPHEDFPPV